MEHQLEELARKLNTLDVEKFYEEEILFAQIKGGASIPDDDIEVALSVIELGPRALAVRAHHLFPLDAPELPGIESITGILQDLRSEYLFAQAQVLENEDRGHELHLYATFLLSDLRPSQIQTLLTGLILFAEEVLLTIGTIFTNENTLEENKEKN